MEWQPIETAPVGVDVLLYCPSLGYKTTIGLLYKDEFGRPIWFERNAIKVPNPTHWMPLPESPK